MPLQFNRTSLIAGGLAGAGLLATGIVLAAGNQPTTKSFSAQEEKAIGEIVRAYLVENPEVLMEAMDALQAKEAAAADARAKDAIAARSKDLLNDGYSESIGAKTAKIQIVEFFDYNCGFCRKSHEPVNAFVAANKDVRVIQKEFPILGPDSETAALASMASARQGKYAAFHNGLMAHQGKVNDAAIDKVAKAVGLDLKKLRADMNDPIFRARIDANAALAAELGIDGTPSFVIGDNIVGGWDEERFKSLIADERKS